MYRHYKYYIDRLITELKNPLKSDEWYYNLNLFQFQQVLIKFILVSTCTEFASERFATALSGVHCSNELLEDQALGDPVNPKWLPVVPVDSRWLALARSIRFWILLAAPTGGLDTSVLLSRFPAQFTLVALPQAHIFATRGLCLVRGKGKGGCYPTQCTYFNPPGPVCRCRRGKGVDSKDFARGRMFSNNDVAINIQS